MNELLLKIQNTKLGNKLLQDKNARIFFTSTLSMGWNLIYAFFYLILTFIYQSYWFLTMFVYYLFLGLMRLVIIKTSPDKQSKAIKAVGIVILLLSIVISGVITLSIVETKNTKYHLVTMIIIATYTFYLIINSLIQAIKSHKLKNHKIYTLRNISLVSAIGSVLSLERSMLGTFGNPNDSFTLIMEAITGAVAFILILTIGLFTMRYPYKER